MDQSDGKRILILGGAGFLGQHLIRRLSGSRAAIHAVSRRAARPEEGLRWWQGDATNVEWLKQLVSEVRPDVIYQLASASQGGQDVRLVLPSFENDLRTTVNTLVAAVEYGRPRVVLIASLEEPVYDGSPIALSSPYAAAKAAGTFYGLMFHQLYGLPVTILRPFMVYGPGQKPWKLIPYTVLAFLRGESPKLSSGVRPVDWVYVDDVIDAFVTAAIQPDAPGAVIDLGSGELVAVRRVIEQIHELIPDAPAPQIGALPDRAQEKIRCAGTELAARLLNWKAATPLVEGLSKTIEWYRRAPPEF